MRGTGRLKEVDDLEIIGEFPGPWRDDLQAFAVRAAEHSWGGTGLERLVIAPLREGAIGHALREWMDPEEFAGWEQAQIDRPVATGAKSFIAHDGRRTAVVPPIAERADFLMFATHELLEGAQSAREENEGFEFPFADIDRANAHVLRTEYVVERTRLEIGFALDWPQSSLDGIGLAEQVADFEVTLPQILRSAGGANHPSQLAWQHWVNIIRVFAMTAGRAAVGSEPDRAELERFFAEPLIRETATDWCQAQDALDALWDLSGSTMNALAEEARRELWDPLHDALLDLWEARATLIYLGGTTTPTGPRNSHRTPRSEPRNGQERFRVDIDAAKDYFKHY